MALQEHIARASALLSAGDYGASAALTEAILAQEPRNAIAAHLLGLALKEVGDWRGGERWLRFSIELEPQRGEFHANLGNFLRKQRRYDLARQSYENALQRLPDHRAARHGLALTLVELSRHADAEYQCRILLANNAQDTEAWVLLGMSLGHQDQNVEAEAAYRQAIALDPTNAIAQHNLGALLVQLERPEAVAALDTARRLGADGYEATFNAGRAALNEGDLDTAEANLVRATELKPDGHEAQLALAHVRFMRGDPRFARTVGDALRANRDNFKLQGLLANLLWRAGEHAAAETLLRDIQSRKPGPRFQSKLAMVLFEQGRLKEAEVEAIEAAAILPHDEPVIITAVTVLIARGLPEEAHKFILAHRQRGLGSSGLLAYEATVARMLGLDRYQELYDFQNFVRVYDLEAPAGWSSMAQFNQALAAVLKDRHRFTHHPLDQTLRNGTQTSRSLLTDPDPVVQEILAAFAAPIEEYRRSLQLPAEHPLSRANVGVSKFTGAWSVRLKRNGYHVNHIHPEGMLSSAYYVETPAETEDQALKSGWIKFGEPRYPVPGHTPERLVQPKPGRLVLFPSYMWHGTNAIYGSEARMCIAFDIRPTGNR
jgi:Tfp pilus assembly protein PilF